jgi:hypothetical protein
LEKKNRQTTKTRRYRNARNSRTHPLSFLAVGTLIHKGYCSAHLAAEGHTTTGSRVIVKFPELLGSTSYVYKTTQHINTRDKQQLSGHRPTPYTVWPLGSSFYWNSDVLVTDIGFCSIVGDGKGRVLIFTSLPNMLHHGKWRMLFVTVGVDLCFWTATTNGPVIHPPDNIWEWKLWWNDIDRADWKNWETCPAVSDLTTSGCLE